MKKGEEKMGLMKETDKQQKLCIIIINRLFHATPYQYYQATAGLFYA